MPVIPAAPARGSAWEVFRVFLKLGLTSFGGPIAHLGYFRDELVQRRRWLDDREYADLLALCQFLPGPASSQLGFGIGLRRAGGRGAIAAFAAFTLPSAVLMLLFAAGAPLLGGAIGSGALSGLKLVAVAIVAQAVWGMAAALAPDRTRAAIAALAAAAALLLAGSLGQLLAIALGAIAGLLFCRSGSSPEAGAPGFAVSRRVGIAALVVFALLLLAGPLAVSLTATTGSGPGGAGGGPASGVALFDAFYRAGALVFGGGHVVLPLLHAGVVDTGWVAESQFLAGYGAAQALPGPLFSFAAYLGAISQAGPGGLLGGLLALCAVFLPGFLLLLGVLPFWDALRRRPWAQALMRGANAAVVGVLAAALYSPVFTTGVTGPGAFCLALLCFVLLVAWKLPAWAVVIVGAAGGVLLELAG